jgi:hypothetical protein
MIGTQACESTPSFGRLCPAMTDEGLCILYEPGHDGRETV